MNIFSDVNILAASWINTYSEFSEHYQDVIVNLLATTPPMAPEEYGAYVKRSRYRLQHPIKGKIRSAINRIKNHFRGKQREYERRKIKIKRDVAQCYAIAENMYPGDDDAASNYADDCVDNLPSAKPPGE